LAETHVAQTRPRLREVVGRVGTHEGAARVRRDTIAKAAEEGADGLVHRLALEVPARDVDRRERQGEDAARARAAGRAPELGGDRLYLGRIFADREPGELVDRSLERRGERAAEERQAETH